MARIDVAHELVSNHSTEEVVEYIHKELARLADLSSDDTKDEAFRLGALSKGISDLLFVSIHLDAKLTAKVPVVA